MKKNTFKILCLSMILSIFIAGLNLYAQEIDVMSSKDKKAVREIEKNLMYSKLLKQIESQKFVFEMQFSSGTAMVYVLVDSLYGEVQNGNRNNLQGRITDYEVRRNDKKRTVSVSIKMRAEMTSADIFLFIGTYGNGSATINCDFPGNFSFDGIVVDLENAEIYSSPSHFIH